MPDNTRIWPGNPDRGEMEVIEERVVWENPVARVRDARIRVPARDEHGRHIERNQFRLDHGPGISDGVVVVPLADDDRILLVRQFRHPVRMWLRELPRGAGNAGEEPADAAARELKEEVGCGVREMFPLGRIVTDSGQATGIPRLFVARVVEGGSTEREEGESIQGVLRYTFTELRRACQSGDIVDSFTLAAMVRLDPHFAGDRFEWRPDLAPRDTIS